MKIVKKAVHPAPLKLIHFLRAKTCELPRDHSQNISFTLEHDGTKNSLAGKLLLRHKSTGCFFFKGMDTEEFILVLLELLVMYNRPLLKPKKNSLNL